MDKATSLTKGDCRKGLSHVGSGSALTKIVSNKGSGSARLMDPDRRSIQNYFSTHKESRYTDQDLLYSDIQYFTTELNVVEVHH
jgi:hypothetical protein